MTPRPAPALAGSATTSRTATTRRPSARRSVRRRTNKVAADFISFRIDPAPGGAASPARVSCSTQMGLFSIPYGIAVLGRRRSHTDGSGTHLTRRFHEHARGVGSRSLGSFTPSTWTRFPYRSDNPPYVSSCDAAQVPFAACRSRLHVAKRCLHRRCGRRSRCIRASSGSRWIGRASWTGRAQRPSIPGTRLGPSPPTEARGPADAPSAQQHSGDLPSPSRPTCWSFRLRRPPRSTPPS